jgi:hypothetical protein
MSKVSQETRSTIILFIAILIAVMLTVWIILSFDKPNDRDNRGRQTGFNFHSGNGGYSLALQTEVNLI